MPKFDALQAFVWSLGPAAIGLILAYLAEWKVKPQPTKDRWMRIVSVGAYTACWGFSIVFLCLFVWFWVYSVVSRGSYIHGMIEHLPAQFQVVNINTYEDDLVFVSDRTASGVNVSSKTYGWIVRQRTGDVRKREIRLSLKSGTGVWQTSIKLAELPELGVLDDIRLGFRQEKKANGDPRYLLRYGSSRDFELEAISFQPDAREASIPLDKRRADAVPWLSGFLSAVAQTLPRSQWTREQLILGFEADSIVARKNAIAELAAKVYVVPEYAAIANAVVGAKGDEANITRRWSVYEAIRSAYQLRIRAASRPGILATSEQFQLPLGADALHRLMVDALSGTDPANDAAKWLVRFSLDRRLVKTLEDGIEAADSVQQKACIASFAVNVLYNWLLDVPLSAKRTEYEWYVSPRDLVIANQLHEVERKWTELTSDIPNQAAGATIGLFGMGLFFAELSILPPARFKNYRGSELEQARIKWTANAKALMGEFVNKANGIESWADNYRHPWHKQLAMSVAKAPAMTQDLLNAADLPRNNNPRVRDSACFERPASRD